MVRGLREGGTPWLLRAGDRAAILKDGRPGQAALFATEAAALRFAAAAGIPVAAMLGYDNGTRMLLECLPGTSQIPREPDGRRLRALGAAAARIHTVGAAGVDLCSLRCDAAVCYGIEAVDLILAGWEEEAGHPAENVGYWDAIAALSTPPDMAWVAATIADQGRPDLNDGPLLNARRDAFLRQALSHLGT